MLWHGRLEKGHEEIRSSGRRKVQEHAEKRADSPAVQLSGMEHWDQHCRRYTDRKESYGRRHPHGHFAGELSTRAARALVLQLTEVHELRGDGNQGGRSPLLG